MGRQVCTSDLLTTFDILAKFGCHHQMSYDRFWTKPFRIFPVESTYMIHARVWLRPYYVMYDGDQNFQEWCIDYSWHSCKFWSIQSCMIGSRPYPCIYFLYNPCMWYTHGYGLDPIMRCRMGTKILKNNLMTNFDILANFGPHWTLYDRVGAIPLRILLVRSTYVIHARVWPRPCRAMSDGDKNLQEWFLNNFWHYYKV